MKKITPSNIHDSQLLMHKTITIGIAIILFFFLVLGIWAAISPLESASIATGKVIAATLKKTVQHLEGGIIKKINVKEGSVVKKGDVLIQLDDTATRAAYDTSRKNVNELLAAKARLKAESKSESSITYPERLLNDAQSPDIKDLMDQQNAQFNSDMDTFNGQLNIYNERKKQLNNQIQSLEAQVKAENDQLAIFAQSTKAFKELEAKKLIEKTRLWAELREQSKVEGSREDHLAQIEQMKQKIGETEQQIITLKASNFKDILTQLTETQSKLSDAIEKEKATKEVWLRSNIVAPQDGVVVNLQEYTIGGVISPAKAILDIVPDRDKLIIEAHVNPLDIDVVHPGLLAHVQLVAFKQRLMPSLDGVITHVSADSFDDSQTKEKYYVAYVDISPEEFKKLDNIKLYPGMPVQVMIVNEKRSALSYIFTPITDSYHRAFKGQ